MDICDAMVQALSSSEEDCAVNVISTESNNTLQFNQTVDVKFPKTTQRIAIDSESIKKIQKLCKDAQEATFPYHELCLGLSTLFIGAFFSALLAQIPYQLTLLSIFSYTISPLLGIGLLVAFYFLRQKTTTDIVQLATQINEYLCIDTSTIGESEV